MAFYVYHFALNKRPRMMLVYITSGYKQYPVKKGFFKRILYFLIVALNSKRVNISQ